MNKEEVSIKIWLRKISKLKAKIIIYLMIAIIIKSVFLKEILLWKLKIKQRKIFNFKKILVKIYKVLFDRFYFYVIIYIYMYIYLYNLNYFDHFFVFFFVVFLCVFLLNWNLHKLLLIIVYYLFILNLIIFFNKIFTLK